MRYAKRIIPLLLLLSLLITPVASAAPLQWGGYWYQVKYGDTLARIGWATGVSSWSIASANGLWNPNYIWAGQWLWIPATYAPPPVYQPGCGYWRPVYGGETLYSIAWSTGHNAWSIASANGLANWNLIYAGMSLFIPCY